MSALTDAIKKVETIRDVVPRLEKIVDKLTDAFEEESLIELVEAEIRMETPFAENDFIGLTGSPEIRWAFKDIVDEWIQVYSDDSDESSGCLRRMGDQFCELGKMFHEAADMPPED